MIAKGAGLPAALSSIPFILTALASFLYPVLYPVMIFLSIIFLIFPFFILYFFRDPERRTADGIISPADGRIVELDEENGNMDIFMSITDVHVNRSPVTGRILKSEHMSGRFHPAFSEKSKENERRKITISTKSGEVIIHQIAGIFARRIVPYVKEGDEVCKGEKIGMIRFGSRVRLELPENIELMVEEGQRVKAGETKVGRWT